MPRSDRPPPFPKPTKPSSPGPQRPPKSPHAGEAGAGKHDGSKAREDAPTLPLDENDFLWDEDEVTPVAGTAILQALAGSSRPDPPAESRAAEISERRAPSIDPRPSPFERVTVAPPLPEREYVARMMGDAPETDRPKRGTRPMSAAPPTVKSPVRMAPTEQRDAPDEPPSGLLRRETMPGFAIRPSDSVPPSSSKGPPSSAKVRSGSPPDADGALVLDLSESMPPSAGPSKASSGKQVAAPKSPPASDPNRALAFGANDGGALGLVGARAESKPPRPPVVDLRKVRDRFDAGDFSGALIVAEGILADDPDNSDALAYAEHCRDVLKQMYLSRLGGLRRVPVIGIGPEQLRWLSLDHRAGFLLSLVDGRSTIEELLDMSGMSDLEALRLLVQLLQQNVIRLS